MAYVLKRALVVGGSLVALACGAQPQGDEGVAAAEEQMTPAPVTQADIESAQQAWLAAEQADDGAAAGALYAADAVLVTSQGKVEGQEAIAQHWGQAFGAQPGTAGTQLHLLKWGSSGDLSYTLGHYVAGVSAPGTTGHYLTVTQRQADGSLKIVAQISIPEPAPQQ